MTQSHWRNSSCEALSPIVENLDHYETMSDLNKALRDAYPFGERKHWPYKVWLDCCKKVRARWRTVHKVPEKYAVDFGLFQTQMTRTIFEREYLGEWHDDEE